ncbi:MAG: response regulator transcription factor [Cyclobacteriaceae bacterium]|nr:response regulator transcription factor [Cytophagales bacterium]MBX2899282.1 response regulator transcription factor [Cyclobacteriaceae bacterium]
MQQILIAEDDANIASDLKQQLLHEGFEAEVVFDGLLAERIITRSTFDCIILDINMPGKNGLEVCKAIRAQKITTPVLMLTAFGEVEDKLAGFDSGADDYLTKPFYFKELLARIKALLKRGPQQEVAPQLIVHDLIINMAAKTVLRNQAPIKLTAREFEILTTLVQAQGNVVSKKELIKKIWGTHVEVNTNTIEVFINSLRNKVDKQHAVKLIHTRPGFGYFLSTTPHET